MLDGNRRETELGCGVEVSSIACQTDFNVTRPSVKLRSFPLQHVIKCVSLDHPYNAPILASPEDGKEECHLPEVKTTLLLDSRGVQHFADRH